MYKYEVGRVYKYDYERVYYTTLRMLQRSGCTIRAADFYAGVIFATYGDFFHADWEFIPGVIKGGDYEYVWIVFTADENYTELNLYSSYIKKNWEDVLYNLDTELKTHKSFFFTPQKIPRKPRSFRSIVAIFVNLILIYLFVYILKNYEGILKNYIGNFFWFRFTGYEYVLVIGGLIVTAGAFFNAIRQYKIGIPISITGIVLLICSLNLIAITLFVIMNIIVLRDAWFYSKWNKIVSNQKRNKYHKQTIPKSICPYCYETLNNQVKSCPYCKEKFII